MIGVAFGLVSGALMLFCLIRIADAVGRARKIPVLYAVLQPLLILAGLLPCAFIAPHQLVWDGTAMVAVVVLGAVAKIVELRRRARQTAAGNEEKEAKP